MNVLEKTITVDVYRGVHGRVAAGLARIARQHAVRLCILHDDEEIDCSSVLDVLSMAFISGAQVKFRIHGKGAAGAIAAVEKLLAQRGEP